MSFSVGITVRGELRSIVQMYHDVVLASTSLKLGDKGSEQERMTLKLQEAFDADKALVRANVTTIYTLRDTTPCLSIKATLR